MSFGKVKMESIIEVISGLVRRFLLRFHFSAPNFVICLLDDVFWRCGRAYEAESAWSALTRWYEFMICLNWVINRDNDRREINWILSLVNVLFVLISGLCEMCDAIFIHEILRKKIFRMHEVIEHFRGTQKMSIVCECGDGDKITTEITLVLKAQLCNTERETKSSKFRIVDMANCLNVEIESRSFSPIMPKIYYY